VDVHHEVTASRVLHDEAHVFRGLETRKQVDQEGVVGDVHRLKDTLLTHQTGGRRRRKTTTEVVNMRSVLSEINFKPCVMTNGGSHVKTFVNA
jgi:hypothetical protein